MSFEINSEIACERAEDVIAIHFVHRLAAIRNGVCPGCKQQTLVQTGIYSSTGKKHYACPCEYECAVTDEEIHRARTHIHIKGVSSEK